MALIVQKFGGTSVADLKCIRKAAQHVKKEIDAGNQVAVVVSAMAGTTDKLVNLVKEISELHENTQAAEYDTIVSSGEQVTAGLLALTLQDMGIPAQSWLGWQIPIKTDSTHTRARIASIETKTIRKVLKKGEVVVVPGFQGISEDGRITTLGRGGSDTSAVALAAALKADRCDIFTDVDGVYTSDPRIVPKARKLKKVEYEETLEMTSLGAKVLQTRSVEMGMKYNVPVQVRSTFSDEPGTILVDEKQVMERRLITGVTYNHNDAQITLVKVKNAPGVAAAVFGPLAESEINVDMIVQNISESGEETDITFTINKTDLKKSVSELEKIKTMLQYKSLLTNEHVAKISVVGVGMKSHAGLAQKMFKTLADNNINILVISTSEIKVSVLIDREHMEVAMRALHTAYDLDDKG